MDDILFFYVPCANAEEAKKITYAAVEAKLAACGNILPTMQSIYRWDDKLTEAQEAVLILKTTAANADALEELVKKNHSYKVACIARLELAGLNEEYKKWLLAAVKG